MLVLLSLKYAENKPRNPIKAVREFFGNYNDPKWKEVEALKEKIMIYSTENPKLLETVIRLEEELLNLKRNLRITKLFKSYEADKNVRDMITLGTSRI